MAQVIKEDVQRIARLARLSLTAQDAEAMTAHVTKVLMYIEKLNAVPTDGIEPVTHAVSVTAPLRADCVTNTSDPALVQTAPAKDGTFLKVPKIIES